jgi:hypothetical protein
MNCGRRIFRLWLGSRRNDVRQDQYEKLQSLEEQLLDVFFQEVEPTDWPGHGKKPRDMTQQERGDRYWVKKSAAATLALTQRVEILIGRVQLAGAGTTPGQPVDGEGQDAEIAEATSSLDREIAAAEREAAELMRELQTGAMKARFNQHVHGKSGG